MVNPDEYSAEEVHILAAKFNLRRNGYVPLWMVNLFCEALTLADKAIRELRKEKRRRN